MKKDLEFSKERNPRGIPQAPFINSVEEYVDTVDDASTLLMQLQELYQKYQLMQTATQQRLANLERTIPDLRKSVDCLLFVQHKHTGFDTRYELNDTVYAKARIENIESVWLWLGANVMLEYPLEEGRDLLQEKLRDATDNQLRCQEDLEFLRENLTTVEVNTARVINWRVSKKRET